METLSQPEQQLLDKYFPSASKWRGGTAPGRPRKGQETKKRFAESENPMYEEVNQQVITSGEDLFNAADPSVPLIKEKFEHRMLAFWRAQGLTRKEIFVKLGGVWNEENNRPMSGSGKYSYVHLGNIFQQPWFRRRVIDIQKEAGMDQVTAVMAAEIPRSLETILELRDNPDVSPTTRLNAANSLLDRALGKAIQRVESKNLNASLKVVEDAERIDQELRAIDQEFKQLGVGH